MTESEYAHLIFMYYHLDYTDVMSFEEFVNRYGDIILSNKGGDKK